MVDDATVCAEWCHCRVCGGFRPTGLPYGPPCSCPDTEEFAMKEFPSDLIDNMKDVPPEFDKIFHENFNDLLARLRWHAALHIGLASRGPS